mgnify:CR=1 FL=1
MKITNKTHWQTEQLRAFVARIAADELDAAHRSKLHVTFSYTRGGCHSSGYASYTSGRAKVRLSKHTPSKLDLAFVIAHELAHTRGMHHRSMTGDPRYNRLPRTKEIYAWAESMPLEVAPKQARARSSAADKLSHVEKMLARNLTKLKRITTIVKKWRAKERYYLRQVAAAAKPPKDT